MSDCSISQQSRLISCMTPCVPIWLLRCARFRRRVHAGNRDDAFPAMTSCRELRTRICNAKVVVLHFLRPITATTPIHINSRYRIVISNDLVARLFVEVRQTQEYVLIR